MVLMTPEQTRELTNLFASRFIQRSDIFAHQVHDGGYRPSVKGDPRNNEYHPITRAVLNGHVAGNQTIGHYMLDDDDLAKLFAFDIDLAKSGWLPTRALNMENPTDADWSAWRNSFEYVPDLRGAWHDRKNTFGRDYLKRQMRQLAQIFAAPITQYLNIETAAAYSGNKGIHVYGFTGSLPAGQIQEAAHMVLDTMCNADGSPWLEPLKGKAFFADSRSDRIKYDGKEPIPAPFPEDSDPDNFFNFHIEVFPKQTSLEGKKLGNLMRLPLGVNQHAPKNPTFMIDLTSPLNVLRPTEPIAALKALVPWGTEAPSAA